MFENAGQQVKKVATVLFFVNAIGWLVISVFLWNNVWEIHWIIVWIMALIASYVESLLMAAFGELVENSSCKAGGKSMPVSDNSAATENSAPEKKIISITSDEN